MNTKPPRVYRRHFPKSSFMALGEKKRVRFAARAGAVLFMAAAIVHGLVAGGHLDYDGSPFAKLPGQLAGLAGLAADDIEISGLVHQEPETVLAAIGVSPGGSLIGFDAVEARRRLENLDWVAAAKVQRLFPNQLDITVAEREPFAVWQQGESYSVIDRSGATMSGITTARFATLPLVSGEGAGPAAEELINQLEATPDLMLQVRAAARVGKRRWTLHLDNGVAILLPERDVSAALALAERLDRTQQLFSKGIVSVDLRLANRIAVAIAESKDQTSGSAKPQLRQ